jgi:hypothetical protein
LELLKPLERYPSELERLELLERSQPPDVIDRIMKLLGNSPEIESQETDRA